MFTYLNFKMIKVTQLYLELENGTFNPPKSTPITEEQRAEIKRKYPNTYQGFPYLTE